MEPAKLNEKETGSMVQQEKEQLKLSEPTHHSGKVELLTFISFNIFLGNPF